MTSWPITIFGITLAIWLSVCSGRDDVTIQKSEVCDTQECHQVANAFQASMNKSLGPCINFHHYVCGRWESANPKPEYVKSWNSFVRFSLLAKTRLRDELQSPPSSDDISPIQKMKKFYKSCMNEDTRESEGLNGIKKILEDTKGWPMIMGINEWYKNDMPWQEVDGYHRISLGDSAFYIISLADAHWTSNYVLLIKSPIFYPKQYKSRAIYQSLIKSVAQAFIQQNNAMVSHEQLENDIDDLIKLEDELHGLLGSCGTTRNVINLDVFIKEWKEKTKYTPWSRIDWEKVLQRIFAITDLQPSAFSSVVFQNLEYFIELAKILQSTDKRTIVNFIQWKFLSTTLRYTTKEMEDIFNKIENDALGIGEKPRWLQCVERIGRNYASFHLFVEKYYQLDSWNAAYEMFSTVADTYRNLVMNSNWMSLRAKEKVTRNLGRISPLFGHSNSFYYNEKNIIDYYEDLTIGDSYFDNALDFIRHSWKAQIKYWGKSRGSREDFDDPLTVNAEYQPVSRTLTMTAAQLQLPLLDRTLPHYITYGTLGSIIGHEMSHALDYEDLREMLDTEEQEIVDDVAQCFIELYTIYFRMAHLIYGPPGCSEPMMRALFTLNENMADWRGVQTGYHAYKKMKDEKKRNGELKLPGFEDYTDEQMFFISFAQTWCGEKEDDPEDCHSPGYLRVIATLANNVDFAEAFNCPINSPMNQQSKCKFWTK